MTEVFLELSSGTNKIDHFADASKMVGNPMARAITGGFDEINQMN